MDMAFVDILASHNSGVKFLLVAVDVLSQFVKVYSRKTDYSKHTLQVFLKIISRKKHSCKILSWKLNIVWGTFEHFCKEKNLQVNSAMSKTKAIFAMLAFQPYDYLENHDEKLVHKLSQFVPTMSCRVDRDIMKNYILSIL